MNKRLVRGTVSVFYVLIGLEIVIMISPFAAYFYSVYGPLLNFLYGHEMTAWLTGFFLPHAAVTKSVLLNSLGGLGRIIFTFGIIAFLIGAVQVYSAKLRRKGLVKTFFYGRIRHPQYLFIAIAGLGLLLFWPRFLILVLYISMLYVYYLLARHEEQRMRAQHGESYMDYMQRTAMFLPGEPGGKIFRTFFGWIKPRGLAVGASYGVTLILAVGLAYGLRSYTISNTSVLYSTEKKITAVSVLPRSDQSLRDILNVAYGDSAVTALLSNFHQEGHRGFLVHVVPEHYMMQGLFVQPYDPETGPRMRFSWRVVIGFVFPFLRTHSHHHMMGSMNNETQRLIFSQLTWPNGRYAPADSALNFTVKHLPLLKVDIDLANRTVQLSEKTPNRNLWGQMPMPAF